MNGEKAMTELKPVALGEHIYRLFNVGGTSLVSAAYNGEEDVMPATWVCPLTTEGHMTACIEHTHFTRPLIEKSGMIAISLPTLSIAKQVMALGSVSKNDDPHKLEKSGARFFKMPGYDMPLVEGCACYVIFEIVPEHHIEQAWDLFVCKPVAAWSDPRVYENGHWKFETAPHELSTLHYVAGGRFYTIGSPIDVD